MADRKMQAGDRVHAARIVWCHASLSVIFLSAMFLSLICNPFGRAVQARS
jgi:hypothetical protein